MQTALASLQQKIGELREKDHAAPQTPKSRIVRYKEREQGLQVVDARDCRADFLQDRFEVLLDCLLAVETGLVRMRTFSACDLSSDLDVRFGLSYPLRRSGLHIGPPLSRQLPARTNLLPLVPDAGRPAWGTGSEAGAWWCGRRSAMVKPALSTEIQRLAVITETPQSAASDE
mgnify:CR=1 FL=1